ncbi:MAG: hypothetical protein AB8E82_10700 [Aureispira sp.]
MSEIFAQLFSGDDAADLAFGIIIGLSFLLGMLVFALLAYWPTKRRLSKEIEQSKKEHELLTKDYKDLSERFNVVTAQYKHSQEELRVTTSKLKEQEGVVSRQLREIQYLKEELEAHKAQARNYKQANERLLEQFQKAAKSNEAYQRKLEDLKELVEEVEQERAQLQQDYRKSQREATHAEEQLNNLKYKQQDWESKQEQLEQDLAASLAQRQELTSLLQELEDNQQLGNSTDEELKQQLLGIRTHLKSLEAENAELMQRLAPYLAEEQAEKEEGERLEPLLVEWLIQAEESMQQVGFFEDCKEEDLIEDPQQLAKALIEIEAVTQKVGVVEQEEPLVLEIEEEEELMGCLVQAALAMERQGFYENMDEAVLVPLPAKIQQLSDEELLQERLRDTALLLENSIFYNKEADEDDLIEEKELLEIELAKLDEMVMPRALEEDIIALSEGEEQHLVAATALAQEALEQPGLYEPIEAAQLLADTKYDDRAFVEQTEQQQREARVRQLIGPIIPQANPEERNNLQEIDGVGQFMEQQLNQLGIYTYEQISLFDNEFINILSAALDFPADVIHEKQWIVQAKNKLT